MNLGSSHERPRQPGSHMAGSQMAASSHAALPEIEEEEAEKRHPARRQGVFGTANDKW